MAEANEKSVAISSLPPLSSTYQSSYLWTPHQLNRLTINQGRYHDFVSHSLDSAPSHLNVLHRRVQKYGSDSHFHCHRDIPEHQNYSLTALKLSNLRPADQLVDRPMSKDSRVVEKEVGLPFPAEHPYTSHISQFSVFPDTQTTPPHSQSHTHRDASTQTRPAAWLQIPPSFSVPQKAFEKGLRIERHCHSRGHMTDHVIKESGCGQIWDLPRSNPHQRSKTYPAPKVMYPSSSSSISRPTQHALNNIHTLVAGTTSYTDHFGHSSTDQEGPNKTTGGRFSTGGGGGNLRRLFSSFSHSRPYTAENRSKYRGSIVMETREECRDEEENEKEREDEEDGERVIKKDVATQTEPDDNFPTIGSIDIPLATIKRPKPATTRVQTVPPTDQNMHRRHQRSFSVDDSYLFRPRSSITCQRFSELYAFSRSDVMRQFHSQYPEPAPDLRQYGIQSGKRHTIHGYNSYYFH